MKKNIIKTIEHLMDINNLVWFVRNNYQMTNQEQTNSCSWFVEDKWDYMAGDFEYEDDGKFLNVLDESELMFILSRICGLHTSRMLVSKYTDTFGPYAGLDDYRVHDMVECC